MASELDPLIMRRAEALAKRPYQARVFLDESTDDETVYVSMTPEIPGCHSHGDSVEEAKEWLELARIDLIYFLLVDGLPIPEPQPLGNVIMIDMDELTTEFDCEPALEGTNLVSTPA